MMITDEHTDRFAWESIKDETLPMPDCTLGQQVSSSRCGDYNVHSVMTNDADLRHSILLIYFNHALILGCRYWNESYFRHERLIFMIHYLMPDYIITWSVINVYVYLNGAPWE